MKKKGTAISAVALEKNKALENGRALEMFGGEVCKSWAVPIQNSTGALILLDSELVTNSSACSVWCCSLCPMPAGSVKLKRHELGKRQ